MKMKVVNWQLTVLLLAAIFNLKANAAVTSCYAGIDDSATVTSCSSNYCFKIVTESSALGLSQVLKGCASEVSFKTKVQFFFQFFV